MHSFISFARRVAGRAASYAKLLWRRYRLLKKWQQAVLAVVLLALVVGGVMILRSQKGVSELEQLRTVSLMSVGELSGTSSGVGVLGTVRSVTEASILAQSGGTVRTVHTSLGASVPAGYVIATLENASERAAVLQAEGAYDAAVAARSAVSADDAKATARAAYQNAFSALDTTLESDVDLFFGPRATYGPRLIISANSSEGDSLSREREALSAALRTWRSRLATSASENPQTLLGAAEATLKQSSLFLDALAHVANKSGSNATATQLAALASARATVSAQLASVAGAQSVYRASSTSSTASVDAGIKSALGALRAAQAQLEKTVIRAPIAGQVNFLPLRVGDYVTAYTHAATVAQNGALEVIAYVSEEDRALLAVGTKVTVSDTATGIITSIAPALDPVRKQIEVRIGVDAKSIAGMVNGQSVRITLPGAVVKTDTTKTGPLLLPLSCVKLRTDARIVFTVGEDGRLIANPVEIGDVRGDRIEILTSLDTALRIVTDARGLSEGQKVAVAPMAP